MMRFIVLLCSSAADPTTNFRSVVFLSKITSLRLLQNTVYMLQTAGRYHAKRFRKAQCPVVERLTNSLMTHGRNSGKKLMAVGIIKHTVGIYLLTDQNPIQVIMDAVINSGPIENATRIGSAGVVRRQAVDNSPLRRVNQAIYLLTTGARESSFRSIKTIAAESEVQYGTFISGAEESEIQCVANVFPDQQQLEKRNNFPQKVVLEIIKIIRNNGNDLESRLTAGASRLSVYSITEIFEVLNSQRISGLRFIEWIWNNNPQLHDNAHICSLIIDNLGRLDNYESMSALLKKFRSKNIRLRYEAFGFLPVVSPNSIKKSTQKVVDLLNKIGGSCRSSGICALIEMFSKLDLFEMARFVINITERKESYYCILVREKCDRGLIEDAHGVIREMRELHLAPGTTVYNYLLGGSYKNGSMDKAFAVLGEMNEIGIPPDAITFEVLILFVCRLSKMDAVHQLLDQMVCRGLEPRPSTHAAIVKALFSAEKYPEAHKYVVDSCIAYKKSSNMMYSLIASLYREKGDIMSSLRVLVEMMERCLKPNFNAYIKIVKQLTRIGRRNLARDLENRYSKFVTECRARHP